MNKAIAIVTCLISLGPALALAHGNHPARVVVHNYYPHAPAANGAREVVRVHPREKRGYRQCQRSRSHRDEVAYGRVISVEPVYRVTTVNTTNDSCVRYVDDGRRYRSHTSTVLGAVIGAAVGHSIGDSHGDPTAAAIAGGILGASVGRDVGNHVREGRQLVVDGPCRPTERQSRQRELVEYVVRYSYNGEVYRTRMDHDPGEWIALDVDVNPA